MKTFSLVVPCYYNEPNLPDTVPALLGLRDLLPGYRLELVFVDDGSGDRTLEGLLAWQREHPDVIRVVKLSRNFGAIPAAQAGFAVCTGDCVGMTAADLQDPPELFVQMVRHWEQGIKAVYAVRADRDEPLSQRAFSRVYHHLMRRFALAGYPEGGFDTFLADRQLIDELVRMREKNTSITSLVFWMGYAHVTIPYTRRKRTKGRSRWTFSKKVKLFIDSFVALSYAPIRLLSVFGGLVAAGAFVYAAFVLVAWFARDIPVRGYAPVVILLAFTAGVQMMMLGVLGEYLWRTLDEARRRPLFVIDEVYAAGRPAGRARPAEPTPDAAVRLAAAPEYEVA